MSPPRATCAREPYETTIKTTYYQREPSGIRPGRGVLWPTAGGRLTQVVKHRKGRRLDRVGVRPIIGEPVDQPHLVHLERLNGTSRDRLNCLTRKMHGFAQDTETRDALPSPVPFEHNWLLHHIAVRVPLAEPQDGRRYAPRTPAMAIHLTDHRWTWQESLLFRAQNC